MEEFFALYSIKEAMFSKRNKYLKYSFNLVLFYSNKLKKEKEKESNISWTNYASFWEFVWAAKRNRLASINKPC